jgi:hypothetical protein
MIGIENPPGFVVREEAHKAAYENGFRISLGVQEAWIGYRSTTAHGDIWIARAAGQGSWLLCITHSGVAAELGIPISDGIPGPDIATYAFASLQQLYQTLERVYTLGVSLPDAPFESFKKATANLPRTTEAERLTVERVGQSIFRDALLEYWNGRCPFTGIADPALLRASHIIPWSECESDEQRLDVHNGLLLSALWDAAFDCGLISFGDNGTVLRSPELTDEAAAALNLDSAATLAPLTDLHRRNLARHRTLHQVKDSCAYSDLYRLNETDKQVLAAVERLLKELAATKSTRPAQLVSITKVLDVLSRLPRVTEDIFVTLEVSWRPKGEGGRGSSSWQFSVAGDCLELSCGGSDYSEGVGSDSFTTMEWSAHPGQRTEFDGRWDAVWMGDEGGYSGHSPFHDLDECDVSIDDDDNSLLLEEDGETEK